MPIYLFRCTQCATEREHLLPLGEINPRACEECGGEMRHRLARVAIKYDSWGFTSTDRLVSDPHGKDFKALRTKAEKITDE